MDSARGPAVEASGRLMLVVLFRLMLCRLLSVLRGKRMVSLRKASVTACRFIGSRLMMLSCLPMMSRGVLVVFGRLLVMHRTLVFGHFCWHLLSPDYVHYITNGCFR